MEAGLTTIAERAFRWNIWSNTVFSELSFRIGSSGDSGSQRRYRNGAYTVACPYEDHRGDVYLHVWSRATRTGIFVCLRWEEHEPPAVAAKLARIITRLSLEPVHRDTDAVVYQFSFGSMR